MLRPFSILVTEAGQKGQDTSTTRKTRIKESMNRYYQTLWRKFMWHEVTVVDRAISVSSGTDVVVIPKDIEIVHALTELTSDIVLQPSSPYIFQAKYVSERLVGSQPYAYVKAGFRPLETLPSTDSTLTFVSSSTADTTQTITVRAKHLSTDEEITQEISLNGTTPATSTVTFDKDEIYEITKSARTTGTVTIKDSGGTTLDTIAPDEYHNRYDIVRLQGNTDADKTIYLTGQRRCQEMIYDGSIPEFDCCDALVHFAVAEIFESRGQFQPAMSEKNQASLYINDLVAEKEIYEESGRIDTLPTVAYNPIDYPVLAGISGEGTL